MSQHTYDEHDSCHFEATIAGQLEARMKISWKHDFGHLETNMLGQLEAEMQMRPGDEGDHDRGGRGRGGLSNAALYIYIYIYVYTHKFFSCIYTCKKA